MCEDRPSSARSDRPEGGDDLPRLDYLLLLQVIVIVEMNSPCVLGLVEMEEVLYRHDRRQRARMKMELLSPGTSDDPEDAVFFQFLCSLFWRRVHVDSSAVRFGAFVRTQCHQQFSIAVAEKFPGGHTGLKTIW